MSLLYVQIVAGIWLISIALMMQTKNLKSSIIFKVIPFFLGTACLYAGSKLLGWL